MTAKRTVWPATFSHGASAMPAATNTAGQTGGVIADRVAK